MRPTLVVGLNQIHSGVQARHLCIITIEDLCRHARALSEKTAAEPLFFFLAPAWMITVGVHVGIEPVFMRAIEAPSRRRLFFHEADSRNGLDALESILPGNHQPKRCAVLIEKSFSVKSEREESHRMHGLVKSEPFDVREIDTGSP